MNSQAMEPVILKMALPSETRAEADLLGVWRSPPAAGGRTPDQEMAVVWRAELPAKTSRRRDALALNAYLLRRAGDALPIAEQYLVDKAAPSGDRATRPYSLAAPARDEVQRQLEVSLLWAEQMGRVSQPTGEAYATPGEIYDEIRQAIQDTLQFYENLRRAVAQMAWAETVINGQVVGRTTVGWLGNFHTSLQPRIHPAQAADHQRLVQQALASRQAILRMSLLVAAGAAGLVTSSLTGPLAIIGVLNFVKGLIDMYQQLKSAGN